MCVKEAISEWSPFLSLWHEGGVSCFTKAHTIEHNDTPLIQSLLSVTFIVYKKTSRIGLYTFQQQYTLQQQMMGVS